MTNSKEQGPSWEANGSCRTLLKPEIRYRIHKSLALVLTTQQVNPVHALPSSFCKIHFNPLKTKRICFIQGLSPYRAVNTLRFDYKNQSLNVL
jgi:hypothetical protein